MWFVGVDGGGSKCRALIMHESGRIAGEGVGGPANPLHGFERAIESIRTAVDEAAQEAGLTPAELKQSVACLGLAGVNLPSLRRQMLDWAHPFASLRLETDLHVACKAAHGGADGAVIITGTGSCGLALVRGVERQYGGYGFPVGDQASGAWLGLEALRRALLAEDGYRAPTLLQQALAAQSSAGTLHGLLDDLAGQGSAGYAKLARLVFDCANEGDATAQALLRKGAHYLEWLIGRLETHHPARISMLGGLAPLWRPWLSETCGRKLSPPLEAPQLAAAKLARAQTLAEASPIFNVQ